MFNKIKVISGKDLNLLKKPIIYLCIDALFIGLTYSVLFLSLISILENNLTKQKIIIYTTIAIIAAVGRKIFTGRGYKGVNIEGAKLISSLRIRLGDHLRNINLGYFNKNNIGYITNIITNDLKDFEMVITHLTADIIKGTFLVIYLLIIMFFIDTKIALIQLLVVLIGIPIMLISGKILAYFAKKKIKMSNNLISRVVEYVQGISVFKAYNIIGKKFIRLEKTFADLRKYSIYTEIAIVPFLLVYQIIVDITFPIILVLATTLYASGNLNAKNFLACLIVNLALTNIVRILTTQYAIMRYFKIAVDKLYEITTYKDFPYKTKETNFKNYNIEFSDVSFEYEKDEPVLKNVSFVAKEKEMTALIGPSGSGKTTVMSLISRFWDINTGAIKIDGNDIVDIYPDALLQNISMVFQDVYLLNDTVYENIKIGNPKATREEIIEIAKISKCHDFVKEMDNGYDTIIGEGGSTLSGGEKQRISIARALLKDAPIILLDEATASLDADNEFEIRKAIKELIKDKTVIIIAHRLNTILDANKIIVFNEGEIEEMGTHEELLENKKRYFNMYNEMIKSIDWVL